MTGYPASGCAGKFIMQKLESDGIPLTENIFYWWDNASHPAGWYDRTGRTKLDETKTFPQGQGFWTQGSGYSLVSSGEVMTHTILCKTLASGKVSIIQATPVTRKLSDLTVTGYPASGCAGKFIMQKLESDGIPLTENIYYWWDNASHAAGWYDRTGRTPVDAENIEVPSGTGFWVQGSGYSLVLPKVDIK